MLAQGEELMSSGFQLDAGVDALDSDPVAQSSQDQIVPGVLDCEEAAFGRNGRLDIGAIEWDASLRTVVRYAGWGKQSIRWKTSNP